MLSNLLKLILRGPRAESRAERARQLAEEALARQRSGDLEGACRCLEQALLLEPDAPQRWMELGAVHYQQRDLRRAAAAFRAALAAEPDCPQAHVNLGVVLREAGALDEALAHLRRAHAAAPQVEGTLRNLVLALLDADLCEEAREAAAAAKERDPASFEAHLFLGMAHQRLHEPQRALACYEVALSLRPEDAELYMQRGIALQDLGRLDEALADFERAAARDPQLPFLALCRALALLLAGDYARGWDDYEARKQVKTFPRRPVHFPEWDGSSLAGRTILVYGEQGLGDEILFASVLPEVLARAGHCIVECEPRLAPLFARSFPQASVYAATPERTLPEQIAARRIDCEIAAGSLPRFFRRSREDFPHHGGYLKADRERIARWRERLAGLGPGLKVGISWTGGVHRTRRPLRSIPLERWLPILAAPHARFVSLQYTAEAGAEAAELYARHGVRVEHWREAIEDYEETAALVCALDLVVSVCTAVVHLTGALGRPVWVMVPYSPEWRYGIAGCAMPWYPSVRLYRQPAYGEWEPVIASVAAELRRLAGTGAAHPSLENE
ncbi:MAG TPA: tetratricopeptide repeat protein [Burkholderiales bacterium]|nr:tetratricopeptide repeat protein [Burkholderiales bacterium]